ncbi:MAG TPA: hypothetical protein VEX38_00575, partial [Fimbriimonadaceae bacterium]|nr:hypothetical protein [Fimbriimonadaceae bacterium]
STRGWDMEKLYATPKSYLLLDVPASSALASVAHAKFKAFFKDLGDNPGVHVKVEQLDEQAPLRVLVRARGGAFVQVRDKDGKTYHHF